MECGVSLHGCIQPFHFRSIVWPYVNQRGLVWAGGERGGGGGVGWGCSNTAHHCLHSPHVQTGNQRSSELLSFLSALLPPCKSPWLDFPLVRLTRSRTVPLLCP